MKDIKYPKIITVMEWDCYGNKREVKYYREDVFEHVKRAIDKVLSDTHKEKKEENESA